jgi:alpha-L-arabinofuranosidase
MNQGGKLAATAEIWQMNHPDLKATHTFGNDRKVRPATESVSLVTDKGTARYTFPAHSLTILKLHVK